MLFRNTVALASLTLLLSSTYVFGQATSQEEPAAPTPQTSSPAAPPAAPKGPPPFPLVDRANFTAATPSLETVNAFLKASWGYDPNRAWQVQAIEKTVVPGLSRVQVLVEEKGSQQQQPAALAFMVLPDGNHLIASEDVMPFGADPFAERRKVLDSKADGPSKGSPTKSLELVEFADFQCPHCKDAQPTIEKLLTDFPSAHFVYQNFPLTAIHSEAQKAALYGACVAKAGGSTAFFKFSDSVFTNQVKLTPDGSTAALADAVTAAGQDPAKTALCAASEVAKADVASSVQLAKDLGVNQTPWLFINGRGLPLGGVPYETLKQIVAFQMQLDGVPALK